MFEFPVEVADVNAVPEQFRPMYKQPQGASVFKLDTENPVVKSAHEALTGLTKSLKASRAEADANKKSKVDLTPLKDFGEDPAAILENFNAKIKELQDQAAGKNKGELEQFRKDMQAGHAKAVEALEARNKGLQTQLYDLTVKTQAISAIQAEKGDFDLIWPIAKDFVKTVEEDGQLKVYIVGEDGNKRYGATGQEMTIPEFIKEMKGNKKYARLFDSQAPNGGGMPTNGQQRSVQKPNGGVQAELTGAQKISAGLKSGRRTFGAGNLST